MDNQVSQLNEEQGETNNNNEESIKINISKSAVAYATTPILSPVKFMCEPKVNGQKEGGNIIKELIKSIQKKFKAMNPKHHDTIGFESWYIDYKGDLCGITGNIDLFIFLCDIANFPESLLNTKMTPVLPKNLPQQSSIIIKGVPNVMNIEDIKIEIMNKYKSLYYIGEIPGTNNGRKRYIRIDMMNLLEYKHVLNAGVVCIDGQCLHVYEFLASPKILFCSTCN